MNKTLDNSLKSDIIQWDIDTWGKSLDLWTAHLAKVNGKDAAAFGEREGGLSLWLALNDFDVHCTDYHPFKDTPLEIHTKHHVQDQISYEKQDITNIDLPDNSLDVVMFKSVIGTLSDKALQQKALDELYRVLKPGGYLLFAENMEATSLHRFARKKFLSWGERWRYFKWSERNEMLGKFSQSQFKTAGFLATFGRSEKQRKFLAGIDKLITPILPNSWRYVLIGACKK